MTAQAERSPLWEINHNPRFAHPQTSLKIPSRTTYLFLLIVSVPFSNLRLEPGIGALTRMSRLLLTWPRAKPQTLLKPQALPTMTTEGLPKHRTPLPPTLDYPSYDLQNSAYKACRDLEQQDPLSGRILGYLLREAYTPEGRIHVAKEIMRCEGQSERRLLASLYYTHLLRTC